MIEKPRKINLVELVGAIVLLIIGIVAINTMIRPLEYHFYIDGIEVKASGTKK
jgi:hypothetical protein